MTKSFEVYEYALASRELIGSQYKHSRLRKLKGKVEIRKGDLFLKSHKAKGKIVCVPWPTTDVQSTISSDVTTCSYSSVIRFDKNELKFVKEIPEEKVGKNHFPLVSVLAKAQKLKRLLIQGSVEIKTKNTVGQTYEYFLEQGSEVSRVNRRSGLEYKVKGPITGGYGKRYPIAVSTIDYDSIRLLTPEEALTCYDEDVRLLTADRGLAFSKKVKDLLEKKINLATRGFKKTQSIVNNLAAGKNVVPKEIGVISRSASKQASSKIAEIAKELEVAEKFEEFRKAIKCFEQRAPTEVSELFNS